MCRLSCLRYLFYTELRFLLGAGSECLFVSLALQSITEPSRQQAGLTFAPTTAAGKAEGQPLPTPPPPDVTEGVPAP